jgi:hypothetical protein
MVVRLMRAIVLTALVALAACTSQKTLEELEQEALATGNWTEVEKREMAQTRRGKNSDKRCPEGFVNVCLESGMSIDCRCVPTIGRH